LKILLIEKIARKLKEGKETVHKFLFTAFLPESIEKYFA